MSFSGKKNTSSGNGEYPPPIPADQHPAALVGIIDMGTQLFAYPGKDEEWARKVYLVWEVNVLSDTGTITERRFIGKDYRFSFHVKSGLLQLLEAWRGTPYKEDEEIDIAKTLGASCLLSIVHGGSGEKVYAKIDALTKLPKMMAAHRVTPSVKPFTWSLGDDLALIPEWVPYLYGKPIKTKIAECEEMDGGRTAGAKAASNASTTTGNKSGTPQGTQSPPAVHSNGKPASYYEPPKGDNAGVPVGGAPMNPETEELAF